MRYRIHLKLQGDCDACRGTLRADSYRFGAPARDVCD
jgi:hypothetical protein